MDGIIQGRKTLAEINLTPPRPLLLRMCRCLGKACPAQGGGTPKILISISATNPTRFSAASVPMNTCGM